MNKKLLFSCLWFVLGACGAAAASDWPVYKGNAYFTGNNDQIIVKNNNLKWLYQASNYVFNPVVSDGKVYVADMDKVVICLDEETGTPVWKVDLKAISSKFLGAAGVPGKIKYPLVSGNYLYLSDATAIYCLDKARGNVVWARAGLQEVNSNRAVIDGIYADPVISMEKIYYGTRTQFLAREIYQGHVFWSKPGIGSMNGFPTFYDRYIFAQSRDYKLNTFKVICLNASDGSEKWSTSLEVPIQIFSPVVYREKVLIPVNKKIYCLDLESGKVLWNREYADIITSPPSFTEKEILFSVGNRNITVVDADTGAVEYQIELGEKAGPNFVTIQDQIYAAYNYNKQVGGKTVVFGAVKAYRFGDTVPFWTFEAPFPGWASQPIASKGVLFVPLGNYVYALGTYYDRNIVYGGDGNSTVAPPVVTNDKPLTNALAYNPPTNVTPPPQTNVPEPLIDVQIPDISKTETGSTIVVPNIYFEFNQAYLRRESIRTLDDIVLQLKRNPRISLEVQGHTDSIGDETYNRKLSERRADAVKNYLIKNGISPERLTSKGYGMDKPIAPNTTEDGRSKNRRTEFLILGK